MIFLPHLLSIYNVAVCFLRSVKSLIFSPMWIKASLRVSEDMGGGGGTFVDVFIRFLGGIGDTKEVCYSVEDIIIRAPSLDDVG